VKAMEPTIAPTMSGASGRAKEMKAPPKCTEQSTLHVLADHQHGFHGDWSLVSPDRFTRPVTG
jgi:hypothetical protein